MDVANHDAVQKVGGKILEDFGKIDILVNNAGVTRDGLVMRMSSEDWDAVINTNLRGAFSFTQSIVRSMIKQRGGPGRTERRSGGVKLAIVDGFGAAVIALAESRQADAGRVDRASRTRRGRGERR